MSLTSHISKTGERIVREQLVAHLEGLNKMDISQHGSRRGRSTLSQLLEHHDEIITLLENDMNVDSIYLDFAKAFDKCDIGILMQTWNKRETWKMALQFPKQQKTTSYDRWNKIKCDQCKFWGASRNCFGTHIVSHLYI